jgi:hypothetical protein
MILQSKRSKLRISNTKMAIEEVYHQKETAICKFKTSLVSFTLPYKVHSTAEKLFFFHFVPGVHEQHACIHDNQSMTSLEGNYHSHHCPHHRREPAC